MLSDARIQLYRKLVCGDGSEIRVPKYLSGMALGASPIAASSMHSQLARLQRCVIDYLLGPVERTLGGEDLSSLL